MSKADQLRALREARHTEIQSESNQRQSRTAGKPKAPVRLRSEPADGVASRLGAGRTAQDSAGPKAPPVAIQKRGRGRPKVEGKRPWEAEGMSRRTWYRRQKEKR